MCVAESATHIFTSGKLVPVAVARHTPACYKNKKSRTYASGLPILDKNRMRKAHKRSRKNEGGGPVPGRCYAAGMAGADMTCRFPVLMQFWEGNDEFYPSLYSSGTEISTDLCTLRQPSTCRETCWNGCGAA